MLTKLLIRNIVLIEACELTLARGLCVLTGETGAGKSILLDALGLVLGMRSEARLVRRGCEQASVSAVFDATGNEGARAALAELGLEPEDEIRIRRTLTPDGKTKCYLNDEPVGVAALRALGENLIEIHGQHDGRGLLDAALHRDLLDAYGALDGKAANVGTLYQEWKHCQAALAEAQEQVQAALREKDYLQYVQKELGALAPAVGEEASLAEKRTILMQSEKLAETLADAQTELSAGKSATGMVASAQRMLARSALNQNGRFNPAIEALERAGNELAEAENVLERLLRESQYSPAQLEQMEERLFALRAAARKYAVEADALPALLAEITGKLDRLREGGEQIAALSVAVEKAKASYFAAATVLSDLRVKAARKLEKIVLGELATLKMAATEFAVASESLPEERWGPGGIDAVQFLAATNKGAALAPLHKIASGGELSRFMLAMKVALAKVKSTPTLIFDEIDTGTGGAVADAIGQRLAELGKTHQVLVVTHLPQVAARGDHHLKVQKEERGGATFTTVEELNVKNRKEELARMLAGAEVTAEARKAAQKLLQAAG